MRKYPWSEEGRKEQRKNYCRAMRGWKTMKRNQARRKGWIFGQLSWLWLEL